MGLEVVKTAAREWEFISRWNADDIDLVHAKIHHVHNPAKNYITGEFKMPALARQMPLAHINEIVDTKHYPSLHRMKFNKVDNTAFHRYMDGEGRSSIDKIRSTDGTHVTTYYFSSARRLGLLMHDYSMAILIYLNHPARFFTRRTPCKKIDPECMPGCIKILRARIVHWLNDPEPNTARLDKFFFSYVADKHRLCLGYTKEIVKSHKECFNPIEPEYFTLDLTAKYFKEAIWGKKEWENAIIEERKTIDEEMYHIYDRGPDDRADGEPLEVGSVPFGTYCGTVHLAKYNYKNNINVPEPLRNAISNNIFSELWRFDMESFNARNSIHKWTFNTWIDIGNSAENGWWCSWDVSETIAQGASEASSLGGSGKQVGAQLNQVANMAGWGSSNDTSSSDTEYSVLIPKYNGYTYEKHTEPLPQRSSSLF